MKLRLIGTGYGICKIKKKFSRDLRGRGGVLFDEKLLIDAPDDVLTVADGFGYSDIIKDLTAVLISHSHAGHFSVETLMRLSERKRISVYATDKVLDLIPDVYEIEKIRIAPFVPVEIGKFRILPLPANHSTDIEGEVCLNFIVVKDKAVFYALDSGGINFEAWQVLKAIKLDAVIMECALENKPYSDKNMVHQSLSSAKDVRAALISGGILPDGARFLLTHIPTDRKREIHEELSALAAEYKMTVTYDGYFANI